MGRPRKHHKTVQIRDSNFIKWLLKYIELRPELEDQDWSKIVANLALKGASDEEKIPANVFYKLLDKLAGTITLADIALDVIYDHGNKLSREQRDLLPKSIAKHENFKTSMGQHLERGKLNVQ